MGVDLQLKQNQNNCVKTKQPRLQNRRGQIDQSSKA
tara:strand:+ start:367 stop:474 length:108 start_codon:yes stop_codon:yes gene_type:complete